MQHIQEKLQLKAVRLRNFTIAGHKFKNIHAYECGGKCIQILFKYYQDALPEDKGLMVFSTFHDIVKLLMIYGD